MERWHKAASVTGAMRQSAGLGTGPWSSVSVCGPPAGPLWSEGVQRGERSLRDLRHQQKPRSWKLVGALKWPRVSCSLLPCGLYCNFGRATALCSEASHGLLKCSQSPSKGGSVLVSQTGKWRLGKLNSLPNFTQLPSDRSRT